MKYLPANDDDFADEVYCWRVMGLEPDPFDRRPNLHEINYMLDRGFPATRISTIFHMSTATLNKLIERADAVRPRVAA